jgi:hypothetical protein
VCLIYRLPDIKDARRFHLESTDVSGVEQGKQCVVCLYHRAASADYIDK